LIWRDNGLNRVAGFRYDGHAFCAFVGWSDGCVGAQGDRICNHGVEHGLDLGDFRIGQFVGFAKGRLKARDYRIGRHRPTATATTITATGILCKQRRVAREEAAGDKRGSQYCFR
jgi:hypothetical protein